jgi:hypothetical protein
MKTDKRKTDKRWDAYYAKLVAFHKKHGHCKVPSDRKGFGLWVARQRVRKNNPRPQHGIPPLNQDQVDRLNALGFVWENEKDQKWMEMFGRLKEYRRRKGDCCVPNSYKEDPKLATWVTQQRTMNTQGKINADRKEKLNSIGFSWVLGTGWRPGGALDLSASVKREAPKSRHSDVLKSRVQQQWNDSFDRLVEFNKAHGHWEVPSSYEKDTSLASWIETQRSSRDSLDPQQVERLDSIGFPWNNDNDTEEADEGAGMDADYETANETSDSETANEKKGDGTFARSNGRAPPDKEWDPIRGLYAPKGNPRHEKKGSSSKKRDGLASKNTSKRSRRPAVAKSPSIDESGSEEELTGYQTSSWGSEESEKDEPITTIGYDAAKKERASASDGREDFNSRMADLESRKTEDGCLLPRKPPRKKDDGTFARPCGRAPPDKKWDPIRGLYAPKRKPSHEKKGASSIEREEAPKRGSLSGLEEANNGVEMGAEYETGNETSDYETAIESLDDDAKPSARKEQELPVGNEDVEPKYPVGTKVRKVRRHSTHIH